MSHLHITLKAGESIFDQVVFAAIKAFVGGQMRPGERFPSYRALAVDLKIHPNTAQKIIQHLVQERWLEVRPGIGTIVAERPEPRAGDRQRVVGPQIEQLIVEAKRVGLTLDDVQKSLAAQWGANAGNMETEE